MADGWLVEGIKFIGGMAGLGTAAFTIWDRLLKDRPLVSIYGNIATNWIEPELSLRVKNLADEHIIIRAVHVNRPEIKVYPDRSLATVIGIALGDSRFALVDPKTERSFLIFDHGEFLERSELLPVAFEVEWSKTGSRYLGGRVKLRTSNHELARIIQDAKALQENNKRGL